MKRITIGFLVLMAAMPALAQQRRTTTPSYGNTGMTGMSYQSSSGNEVIANMGFRSGAANISAQYSKKSTDYGLGGYFFMQTQKEVNSSVVVHQVMGFGGQIKANLVDNSALNAYISPGFGFYMVKDVLDGAKKSDKTAFGPSMRIGVLVGLTPSIKVGLEHFEWWNWFDELVEASGGTESAAIAFEF